MKGLNKLALSFLPGFHGWVYFIFIIICCNTFQLNAEVIQPRFKRFNIEDGLSQTGVIDIVQDELGFVWIGTQYGLNRYDGNNFQQFFANINEDNSLSTNYISRLDVGLNGDIWVLTSHGLESINTYDLKIKSWQKLAEDFVRKHFYPKQPNLSLTINDFRLSKDGYLYLLINYEKIIKINTTDHSIKALNIINAEEKDHSISGILWLEDNRLLVQADNCFIFYREQQQDDKVCFDLDLNNVIFSSDNLQNGEILLPSREGFLIYNLANKKLSKIDVVDGKTGSKVGVTSFLAVEQGYWLGTVAGLKFLDKKSGKISKSYYHNSDDEFSISNDDILKIYRSNDGLLWVGTSFGLNLQDSEQQFIHLLQKKETKTFKLSNLTTSLGEDSYGNLWIGTSSSGLYKYTKNRSLLHNFIHLEGKVSKNHIGFISRVFEGVNRNLWVLADNGLSVKYLDDKYFQTTKIYKMEDSEVDFSYGYDLIQDRYANLWLGGAEGLFKIELQYDPKGRVLFDELKVKRLTNLLPDGFTTGQYAVYTLYEDLQGYIWVGGSNGLVRLNPNTLKTDYYKHSKSDVSSLSSSDIGVIYEDFNGVLWVGTSSGLNRVYYNEKGKVRFKRFSVSDGFASDYIASIEADDEGYLWISTALGLSRFHPANKSPVLNFSFDDGLQHNEFFTRASLQKKSGQMFFGGVNGITAFDPTSIKTRRNLLSLKVTSAVQSGHYFSEKELTSGKLLLQPQKPLDIYLSDFNFLSDSKLKIRYKFDEDNIEWNYLESSNKIRLHDLNETRELLIQYKPPNFDWQTNPIKLTLITDKGWFEPRFIVFSLMVILSVLAILLFSLFYRKNARLYGLKDRMYQQEKAKQALLMDEKKLFLDQIEDLHYSLSEQQFLTKKLDSDLKQQAILDELTGLYTRGYIRRNINQELASIARTWINSEAGVYLGIFSLELDNYSSIKQQYGHLAANEVLKQVSECLRTICYGTDILVRWEGPTIMVLSRGISKREQMVMAEKIRNIVASRKFILSNGKRIDVTVSIGFTRYPFLLNEKKEPTLNWSKINYIAENALVVAQSNSLNAWVGVFSNQFTSEENIAEKLLEELPALINSGQLDYVSSIPKSKKLHWE